MRVMVPDYLAGELLPSLRQIDPVVELTPVSATGEYPGAPRGVEVLFRFFTNDRYPGNVFGASVLREVLQREPTVRWIHNGTAGVDRLLFPELVESDVVLTNGAGAHRRAIAETVLGYLLADAKALVAHLDNQRRGRWQHLQHQELRGQTVAVLGLGRVGLEIAQLCHAIGLRVIGTKGTITSSSLPGVDKLFPAERQIDCVREADYIVVAAAATRQTYRMIDASTLGAMKPTAALVNIARGNLIDEPALVEALTSRRLRAAYLDVFVTEPLLPDSPFYDLANVVVTPHNAAWSPQVVSQAVSIFLDNYHRYVVGQPLINVVDKRRGY